MTGRSENLKHIQVINEKKVFKPVRCVLLVCIWTIKNEEIRQSEGSLCEHTLRTINKEPALTGARY